MFAQTKLTAKFENIKCHFFDGPGAVGDGY